MVDDRVSSGDLAAVLLRGRGHLGGWLVERPHAGIGAEETHLPEVGEELLALADQGRHLVARDLVVVRILDALLGRAQDGNRVDGHHDVAVRGLVAAVDHRVGHALVVDEHRALAGVHRDGHVDHRRDLPGPGTRTRDDEPGRDARQAPGVLVADGCRDDPVTVALHRHEPLVGHGLAAAGARVRDVRFDEVPRLDGAIRQLEDAADAGVEGRLAPQRLLDRDLLAVDVGGKAGRRKRIDVVVGIVRRGDEEASRVLDAGRCDATEDAVLRDALARGERVLGDVSAARVEEAVVPPGGAGAVVAALDKQRAQASPRQIAEHPGPGRTPADDEDVVSVGLSHAAHLDLSVPCAGVARG